MIIKYPKNDLAQRHTNNQQPTANNDPTNNAVA